MHSLFALLSIVVASAVIDLAQAASLEPEVVYFMSGDKTLGGELYKPEGPGPFPALLYNHGSAPGMLNSTASRALAPLFIRSGWVFFMPYRRGQGLSSGAGPYIGDEISAARRRGGSKEASEMLAKLLVTAHLEDQLAAFDWLKAQDYVIRSRIAAGGNSFGGVEAVLGSSKAPYCAVAAASAASESWAESMPLQRALRSAARGAKSPVFLFQAQNDYDLSPNKAMFEELKLAGRPAESRVYPAFGRTVREGHSFAYLGGDIWFPDLLNFFNTHCK